MGYRRSYVVQPVLALTVAVFAPSAVTIGQETARPTHPQESQPPSFDLHAFARNANVQAAHANNIIVYGEWTGAIRHDGVPEGFKIIDGDIIVPADFGEGGVAATYDTDRWFDGVIPYEFDSNVSQDNANAMGVAMNWWESVASVDFRPRNQELYFIHIEDNSFNNSAVGMQVGGQIINITSWGSTGIMAHELGHALGFWHEQSRADRNNYVTINLANVCQDCCDDDPCDHNFDIEGSSLFYGPYDFDSIMHYGRCEFTRNSMVCQSACPSSVGETVTVKPQFAEWQCGNSSTDPNNAVCTGVATPFVCCTGVGTGTCGNSDSSFIGQRTHLSYWDSLVMSFMYPRPEWRFQAAGGGDDKGPGDFLEPYATFREAWEDTPPGGTLWIMYPSSHGGVDWSLDKPMTIVAPLGGVILAH